MRKLLLLAPLFLALPACEQDNRLYDKSIDSPNLPPATSREEFELRVKTEVKKFETAIADLKSKARDVKTDASIAYNNTIDELERKKDALKSDLDKFLSSSTADASEKIRSVMERTVQEFKTAYDKAVEMLKK